MEITPIGYAPRPVDLARRQSIGQADGSQPGASFADALTSAVQGTSQLQHRADDMASQVALGKDVDVHDAVLAAEEANLAFQYTLQVRNKLIEAYQEVMRMQV